MIGTIVLLTIGAAYVYLNQRLPAVPDRPLRIGFEPNPPVQIRTRSGFSGLAVDVVNQAAARAGIKLEWVETGHSSYESFEKGLVDLWPLMVETPERRKLVYFPRPWMHSTYAVLLRSDARPVDQTFTGNVAVFNLPLHINVVREQFPHAHTVPKTDVRDAVRDVCAGNVGFALLESRAAVSLLRDRLQGCEGGMGLRIQQLPTVLMHAGVASTYAAAGAAEKIQSEIEKMFLDGSLAALITQYGYFGLDDTWASYQAVEEAQRSRWMSWTISALIVALALGLWHASSLRERKRTEEALRESEERFRNLSNTAPVMIVECGPDGKAVFFNKVWLDFTGRSMEQEVGYGWIENLHPDDKRQALSAYSKALADRKPCHVEHRVRRVDGEYRHVLCSGVPHFHADGSFGGYVASCVDLTEVRRSQEEGWARQNLESLGVLARGIAHDFNNLLGGALAYSELAEARLEEGSQPNEELTNIKTIAVRGSEIVRQLMIFAGQETGTFQAVDVSSIVSEILELLKISISKHAVLEVGMSQEQRLIQGDPARLRQVVMNLVMNASEAIGERNGVIRISVGAAQVDVKSSNTSDKTLAPGEYVQLEISDTGIGMTQETQNRIFDPFFTTKFAGRGLGLATVKSIVLAHRGAIEVTSSVGHGTSVQVLLPCAAGFAPSSVVGSASRISTAYGSGSVLIVEDESTLRSAVSRMLQGKGFTVSEASDGTTAMEILRSTEEHFDAMLLDFTLPGVSSREVFDEARRLHPDLKVILTSAYDRDTVNANSRWLNSAKFIRKPFKLDELLGLLGELLSA